MNQDSPPVPRRRFLAVCMKASLAIVGLVAVAAGVDYYFPSLRRRFTRSNAPFLALCPLEEVPTGKWKLVSFPPPLGDTKNGKKAAKPPHSAWVRRDGDGADAIRVLSPICPHNGCVIAWKSDRSAFVCPCHGGTFDVDGQHKSGPPRRGMDPLEFRVEQGQLLVQWVEFEGGMSDRVRAEAS
jgi:quinol---cytochrome c reductase iron-sulfur subunit, bacillus type